MRTNRRFALLPVLGLVLLNACTVTPHAAAASKTAADRADRAVDCDRDPPALVRDGSAGRL